MTSPGSRVMIVEMYDDERGRVEHEVGGVGLLHLLAVDLAA